MKMTKLIRSLILSVIMVLVPTSCSWFANTTDAKIAQATPALPAVVTIELTVQADTSIPFNTVGQIIKYNYTVKNISSISTPGPVSVPGATCPEINTVGNLNTALDMNEALVCTSAYTITQADLDKGSVTTITMATVNGINSNQVITTVATVPPVILKLIKTANPVTYDHVGQTITYAYVITNSGSATLGPAQFTVSDTGIGTPINCGDATLTLASNATVTCSATYTITQADMNAASVATSATASGGGLAPSQPASATITKSAVVQPNPSNLTPGSTIKHTVIDGEWLWQIARCYRADPNKVIQANPQLSNPSRISPGTTVTVPNIGSEGHIYGPPCVGTHTVQSGDTWNSIALKYNADPTVLQMVNSNILTVGSVVKVPLNSAGGTPTASDLIRISFAAGATSATQTSIAPAGNRPIHYVLNAKQGQVMTVKLTAPANSISLVISAPNGSTLKPTDLNLTWSGTLPADGDYRLDVNNALGLGASGVPFTLEVSVTGNCVDLTRSLKLAGVNANITHFNVCGAVDASRKMKIGTIKVYQRPEDVGLGGLLQDITVSIETSTALNDANSLIVGDMNYDGNDDFRIVKNQPAGPNIPYLYYIYDPATRNFVYNKAYENITSPEFPGNSEVRSKWRESATKSGIDTYTIANNTPRLTRRETWEAINGTQATHLVTVFNADGTSQVTVNETVPLPIP
jgi:LysM repeat protein